MARILLIDDDAALRGTLALSLTYAGHEVVQADNGAKAVAMFKANPANLVITDLVMPEQEGIETIRQLRRAYPKLGIIAMSGGLDGSEMYLNLAKKLGANYIMAKPFAPKDMILLVEELLVFLPHNIIAPAKA